MANTRTDTVNYTLSASKIAGGTVSKAYWKHAVIYGDYMDLRIYKDVKITHYGLNTNKNKRSKGTKRNDSLARSKIKTYRLISANVGKHGRFKPIFATYTFKEQCTELDEALRRYRRYQRLLKADFGFALKYVTVPQIQWDRYEKEGVKVWHFHTIYFNIPKLDIKKNDEMWGEGKSAVNLQFVKHARNTAAYLAGYFTKKDYDEIPLNRRFYYCSRGLIQPYDLFSTDAIQNILENANIKLLTAWEGENFSQIKYKLA